MNFDSLIQLLQMAYKYVEIFEVEFFPNLSDDFIIWDAFVTSELPITNFVIDTICTIKVLNISPDGCCRRRDIYYFTLYLL